MAVHTYDPKKVTISFGSHAVTGYAEDSFVSIQPNADGVTAKVGCDGEIMRSLGVDHTYTITVTLLQSSKSSIYLKNRFDADRKSGTGIFPVLIKDVTGATKFQAAQAWVTKMPERVYGRESQNYQWTIMSGEGTFTYGVPK